MDFSEEMIDEILKIFQVESEEIISKLNNNLLNLEKNPKDKDSILTLFRDIHTLKGASRMVDFKNVQTVAHKMEDILGLAKDGEILLNANVVDTLYKAVDFLSETIQKSIEKGQEIYSDEIPKYLMMLEEAQKTTSVTDPKKEQLDFNSELLIKNIEKINNLIAQGLFILMEIETEKNEELIQELLQTNKDLYEIFKEIGLYGIKKDLEDVIVKLEFTTKGSNDLTNTETGEIHLILDRMIEKLLPLCEIYNMEIIDYYSIAFEKMAQKPAPKTEKTPRKKASTEKSAEAAADILETMIEPTIEQHIWEPTAKKPFEETLEPEIYEPINLDYVKNIVANITSGSTSLNDIKNYILNLEKDCENKIVKTIFQKNINILDFAIQNKIKLDSETIEGLKQSLDYCENIIEGKKEIIDQDLILQGLEIIQQVLELKQKSENEQTSITKGKYKIRQKSIPDITDVFNTGEIRTLRVDSSKLDVLLNQISEIMITKIETKKHSLELANIKNELEDFQTNTIGTMNYLKHYDKKFYQSPNNEIQTSFFIRQLLNVFSDNNKKMQDTIAKISGLQRNIQEGNAKVGLITDNLESMVKSIRILPLATVFHLFGRMIRDIAKEKNKEIDFEITGSETSTDKKIVEEIKTPLIHIIRNSIDHGIEAPEERIALGKPPNGKIVLDAHQSGNKVIITITDDGKGIDVEKIKSKALKNGFLSQEELDSMTDEQITNLIFLPGFSTEDEVTNISGRGIGLDIVQTKISQLNGQIRVLSELNKGCCVQIELPTTMSTTKVFLVKASEQTFAIPMEVIQTVLRKERGEIISNKNERAIVIEGKTIPLCDLSDILNLKKTVSDKTKETIIIIEHKDKIMALCVDKLIGDQEILHKKLSAPFYKLKNISGITTLVSGETCLVLNISDIISSGIKSSPQPDLFLTQTEIEENNYKILLVDDSTTTSTLEKNILAKNGYEIEIAQNPIEAFEKMKNCKFNLIISDIEMPEMNGFEFLEKIKSSEIFSNIPVIILSSLDSDENREHALNLGATKYLSKGHFDQEKFKEAVAEILNI